MSNICEICGGVKDLVYLVEAVPEGAINVAANSVLPSKPWGHLCFGHPMDGPTKHDGKLDENGNAEVWFTRGLHFSPHVHIGDRDETIVIDAKQAISLLSWLEQNRAELIALAEQEQS